MPTKTYQASAFLDAAEICKYQVVVGSEQQQALETSTEGKTVTLDFNEPEAACEKILIFAKHYPLDAIVPLDDDTAVLAALASEKLGLASNPPEAVRATRLKHVLRQRLMDAGLPVPKFQIFSTREHAQQASAAATFPCVLKPTFLSGSRGVIRADDTREFIAAFTRIAKLLQQPGLTARGKKAAEWILVEEYLPGEEVALEGILTNGKLKVLTIFDKPDPLEGPFFAETIYVTPSRFPQNVREDIENSVAKAAEALGLRHGPVHAEIRINTSGAWILEIAARSIGGLCARALRFQQNMALEEVILRHAVGKRIDALQREESASGVMMMPVPKAGTLKAVHGAEESVTVPGVLGLNLTIPVGQKLVPLPEGDRYLGFIFAKAASPEEVEQALRKAYRRLEFEIEDDEA
ncbi:MAG: ATP-grasp domain-containing protein [bacterium]